MNAAAAKSDTRHELAMQHVGVQSQIAKLERELADATVNRNRALARATMDGSKANAAARDTATGIVVRLEAELAAARSALATVEADAVKLNEAKRIAAEAQRLKTAAKALADATAAAAKADEALLALAEHMTTLKQAIVNASVATPAELRKQVFGHELLGERAIHSTATWLLSKSGLTPRPVYEPSDYRQTLAALVERFGQPVTDAADAALAPTDWEN
jgi:imidazolonepropionase-like amidohydrolase